MDKEELIYYCDKILEYARPKNTEWDLDDLTGFFVDDKRSDRNANKNKYSVLDFATNYKIPLSFLKKNNLIEIGQTDYILDPEGVKVIFYRITDEGTLLGSTREMIEELNESKEYLKDKRKLTKLEISNLKRISSDYKYLKELNIAYKIGGIILVLFAIIGGVFKSLELIDKIFN